MPYYQNSSIWIVSVQLIKQHKVMFVFKQYTSNIDLHDKVYFFSISSTLIKIYKKPDNESDNK